MICKDSSRGSDALFQTQQHWGCMWYIYMQAGEATGKIKVDITKFSLNIQKQAVLLLLLYQIFYQCSHCEDSKSMR